MIEADAGEFGKVSGTIIDRKTREPLQGANVVLTGTNLGAATDANGEYFILRVPPGTYTLRVRLLGYDEIAVKNVRASIDQTTRINVEMAEESLTLGEEIVITAERPPVQRDEARRRGQAREVLHAAGQHLGHERLRSGSLFRAVAGG